MNNIYYPHRPYGEDEYAFWGRVSKLSTTKECFEMDLDDFLRACAYEYMAGSARRDRLLRNGLGDNDSRLKYYNEAIKREYSPHNV